MRAVLMFVVTLLVLAVPAKGQEPGPHQPLLDALRTAGMSDQQSLSFLARIVAGGPRLAGSKQAAGAVELTRQMMVDLGLEKVHLEPVTVKHWVRGEETARIVGGAPLAVAALGGSVGTAVTGVEGEVVEVHSLEECDALGDAARDKIIFFNRPMDPSHVDTFKAYGGAADQRVHAASRAAAQGAIAVLVRSMTMRHDDVPHTGIMKYAEGVAQIPAAAVSLKGADALHAALQSGGPVRVHLTLGCKMLDPVTSYNVVGDITGSKRPDDIILVGGHLDSWDVGDGAHDDGAGCAQALEVARLFRALNLAPQRTIRVVLFMDEEFGGTGGKAYAVAGERAGERHVAAIESDRGGFLPLGFTARTTGGQLDRLNAWQPYLASLGLNWIREGYGGVDINPLADQGTLTLGLYPDSQRYFDVHHSANDVLATVNPRELELGAIAMAGLAWLLSEEWDDISSP